jgi:hypothetical protein
MYWGCRRMPAALAAITCRCIPAALSSPAGKAQIALDDGDLSICENTPAGRRPSLRVQNNSGRASAWLWRTAIKWPTTSAEHSRSKPRRRSPLSVALTGSSKRRPTDLRCHCNRVVAVSGRDANAQSTVVLDAPAKAPMFAGAVPTPVASGARFPLPWPATFERKMARSGCAI